MASVKNLKSKGRAFVVVGPYSSHSWFDPIEPPLMRDDLHPEYAARRARIAEARPATVCRPLRYIKSHAGKSVWALARAFADQGRGDTVLRIAARY